MTREEAKSRAELYSALAEALKLLKQGKALRRTSWSGTKRIILVEGCLESHLPYIRIITKDNKYGVYTATNCDILADDWEITD